MRKQAKSNDTSHKHLGLPDGWAIIEEALDGRLWFYPAWLARQGTPDGYLAPVYFPPSEHDYREDRAEVRRFTRRDRALAFLRGEALRETQEATA